MYGPRPIRFSAHWRADYSKYRGFLAGGISIASFPLPFFGTRLRRQNVDLAPTQYRQLRRLSSIVHTFRVVQVRKYSPNSRCRPSSCLLAVLAIFFSYFFAQFLLLKRVKCPLFLFPQSKQPNLVHRSSRLTVP